MIKNCTVLAKLVLSCAIFLLHCAQNAEVTIPEENLEEEIMMEDYLSVAYLMGKFDPAQHKDFVEIDIQYANRAGLFMRQEAYASFKQMYSAAQEEDIQLIIVSAARNFDYQKGIWERKWNGETLLEGGINAATDISDPVERARKILEYSSMPGSSRHHWGTDVDFNSLSSAWFQQGEGKKLLDWLELHAEGFGFCRPYTKKDESRPNGYNEEEWHWSYTPIASKLTQFASTNISNEMIKGFAGDQTTEQIDILGHFILGINEYCNE